MNGWESHDMKYSLFAIVAVSIISGMTTGVATNAVNAFVSGDYYYLRLGFSGRGITQAIIGQGAIEGSGLGAVFGVILVISAIAIRGGNRCELAIVWPIIVRCIRIVCAAWVAGGILGAMVGLICPHVFVAWGVPDVVSMAGYGWVLGAIHGAYAGALIAAIYGPIHLHRTHKSQLQQPGFAVRQTVLPTD